MEDLDERSGQAFAARTLDELDALLADLPRGGRHGPTHARAVLLLLVQGILCVLVGVIFVTIALLWALVWAVARLAAATAGRALDSGRAPEQGGAARRRCVEALRSGVGCVDSVSRGLGRF